MSAPTHSSWLREAVIETLVGMARALLTFAALLFITHVFFSGVPDFDYDFGLRLRRLAREHLLHRATPLQPKLPDDNRFLFLDIDSSQDGLATPPGGSAPPAQRGSLAACSALALSRADRYTVSTDSDTSAGAQRQRLDCDYGRPINRYLLAEVVRALKAKNPHLIVLDIELASEAGTVPPEETNELLTALSEPSMVPVAYVRPATFSARMPSGANIIHLNAGDELQSRLKGLADRPAGPVLGAAALPDPGQPLRSYPRCYPTSSADEGSVPSLPYLSALLIDRNGPDRARHPCVAQPGEKPNDAFASPRIEFEFPSLRSHQDARDDGEDFKVWSIYRQVYNRCLAANFWTADSECSREDLYRARIVVIGASSEWRRDRHYTPIGDMSGAEVVINAIQSFTVAEKADHRTSEHSIWAELQLIFVCSVVWLLFQCFKSWLNFSKRGKRWAGFARWSSLTVVFTAALLAVIVITVYWSVPSFTVIVAVLGVAIEQYVEAMIAVSKPLKRSLERRLPGFP